MNESVSFLRSKYGQLFPDFTQDMDFGGQYGIPASTQAPIPATGTVAAIPTKEAAKSLIQAAKEKEQPDRFWIKEGMRLAAEAERRKALEDADRFSQGNDNLSANMAMLNAIPGMVNLNQQQAFRSRGLGVMAGR